MGQIVTGEHVIDCSVSPFIPKGLTFGVHRLSGQVHWDPKNFKIWFYPAQKGHRFLDGLLVWLQWMWKQPVYNACVLDYWLAHPEIIPAECKGKRTYFPDTVYRDSDGDPCVRCLDWSSEGPISGYRRLNGHCDAPSNPAAGSVRFNA